MTDISKTHISTTNAEIFLLPGQDTSIFDGVFPENIYTSHMEGISLLKFQIGSIHVGVREPSPLGMSNPFCEGEGSMDIFWNCTFLKALHFTLQ